MPSPSAAERICNFDWCRIRPHLVLYHLTIRGLHKSQTACNSASSQHQQQQQQQTLAFYKLCHNGARISISPRSGEDWPLHAALTACIGFLAGLCNCKQALRSTPRQHIFSDPLLKGQQRKSAVGKVLTGKLAQLKEYTVGFFTSG